MNILYVEDNDTNILVVVRRLNRHGFTVTAAMNGLEGVERALSDRPDLILMDLALPGIDGWEATRRLKAAPETKDIPIIALSAHAMASHRERALAAGCDDFETKPIDFGSLLAKIQAVMDRRRSS